MTFPFFRRRSNRMTTAKAALAKFLVMKLGLFQHQAAALLGVNQGRVSEVITGKRFKSVKPAKTIDPDQLELNI
ncbi:hypothetical protein ACFO5Q_02180 [Kordiimonas lipolytica]|uniref:HTH cro/C1-type domain-containing protein n=1 Tax=Kordiimonas lipolytica TaxID=1662421 RepID=A0ABV8U636_9PROT|nr:hypothetical protein [Kordiimonas lipolytica]